MSCPRRRIDALEVQDCSTCGESEWSGTTLVCTIADHSEAEQAKRYRATVPLDAEGFPTKPLRCPLWLSAWLMVLE
jgi:hypothetical protein